MSLTHFIRDYVFMASYKAAATNFPRWARAWSYGLLFLALFITGIWHGTTCGFAVFGILHGVAAAVNRAYGDVLKAVLGRAGLQRYLNSPLIRLVAIVATLHYVCFTFLAFASDISLSWRAVFIDAAHQAIETAQALVRLPATTAGAAALASALILAAGFWKSDAVGNLMAHLTAWLTSGSRLNAVLCANRGPCRPVSARRDVPARAAAGDLYEVLMSSTLSLTRNAGPRIRASLLSLGAITAFASAFAVSTYVVGTQCDQFLRPDRSPSPTELGAVIPMDYAILSHEKNDVIILGDSCPQGGIDPVYFEELTGLRAYNLASFALLGIDGFFVTARRICRITPRHG